MSNILFQIQKGNIFNLLIFHRTYKANSMRESQEFCFKIAVIGDSQVGKTSLMDKFTKKSFDRDNGRTFGVKVSMFNSEIEGNLIKLGIWDIAGGTKYHFLLPGFLKESKAAILVFSLEDNDLGKESFIHIPEWHKEILKNCGEIPVFIFANKVDLVNENKLSESRIKNLVEEYNFRGYYLTSAMSESVIRILKVISKELYEENRVLHLEFKDNNQSK